MQACWSATFASKKPSIDPKAAHHLTYGLFLLTAKGEKDNGCTINTAFQVAADPFRILISVQQGNYTRELIEAGSIFNLSVLTENVPFELIRRFGMQSGREVDKLDGFHYMERTENGLLCLTKYANAVFSCKVTQSLPLGSHTVFIGEVTEARVLSSDAPCTYAHYHKAIKPKF